MKVLPVVGTPDSAAVGAAWSGCRSCKSAAIFWSCDVGIQIV